jgi:hypothetical protein
MKFNILAAILILTGLALFLFQLYISEHAELLKLKTHVEADSIIIESYQEKFPLWNNHRSR